MGDDDVSSPSPTATWASLRPGWGRGSDLARFAGARHLHDVFIVVPWDGGDRDHLRTGADLRSEGVVVSALGAEALWALDPRPYLHWIRRVRAAVEDEGAFEGIHLDVEPWRLPVWDGDRARATRGLLTLFRRARELAPDLPLSADLPHWLAGEPFRPPGEELVVPGTLGRSEAPVGAGTVPPSSRPRIRAGTGDGPDPALGGPALPPPLLTEPGMPRRTLPRPGVAAPGRTRGSVFDAALALLDAVTILVPRTRAHGPGGILEASSRARAACAAAGVPYLIGLETRPRGSDRRPRQTFHDEGEVALLREAERIHEALEGDGLFRGIAVHDWEGWAGLGPGAPAPVPPPTASGGAAGTSS